MSPLVYLFVAIGVVAWILMLILIWAIIAGGEKQERQYRQYFEEYEQGENDEQRIL